MSQQVLKILQSLLETLVSNYKYSLEKPSMDEIRRRLAEAISLGLEEKQVVKLKLNGVETQTLPENLIPAEFKKAQTHIEGNEWSLILRGEESLDKELQDALGEKVADAIQQFKELSHSVETEEALVQSIEETSHAERILARLRQKFVASKLINDPEQVFFGIYRSDWQAFHIDRDIGKQFAQSLSKIDLRDEIKQLLQNQDVQAAIDYWVERKCRKSEQSDIRELLEGIKTSEKTVLNDNNDIQSFLLLWSIIAIPKENTMTWSVLKAETPSPIWRPTQFEVNPLQKLIVAIESSIGLYDNNGSRKPFVVVPVPIFGQPRLAVYFMKLDNPEEVKEVRLRTFFRESWEPDVIDAFQTEFLSNIQKQILTQPKADVWEVVIKSLPLFLNLLWVARFDSKQNLKHLFCVEKVQEYVKELKSRADNKIDDKQKDWLNLTSNIPAICPTKDNHALLQLPVRNSQLLIELEVPDSQVKPHLPQIWHLVQEAVQLGYRQQEQTRRLISWSTHDLNMFVSDLKEWMYEAKQMIPSNLSALDKNSLEFASGAMIHTGWIPLQIWRDTLGYLLEGESKYPNAYNYDFSELLNCMYQARKARTNIPADFQQQGIQETASRIPADIKPLFQTALYNMANNALQHAEKRVKMNARLDDQKVQIQCSNDAPLENRQKLQELEEDIKLIRGGVEFAFERLTKRSGLRGWAMMAQNRLGARGWEFKLRINQNSPQDNHIQVAMSIILKWEEVRKS